ncbi:E3 SUMO-protein ligase ZBED1 isoform X1 [Misgurnus anguillicaudatus]|uniref:E3 SUMO-protein ligase ZBED1 isoform X1 n=2 Tax=Misgurnus anguillicaudatus TaxID=75329 RepID=UPI003CCF4D5E
MDNMKKEEEETCVKVQARHCSVAWKYFIKNDGKGTVFCKLCKTTFKFSSNTANMIKHLRVRHRLNIPAVASGGERLCAEEPAHSSTDMNHQHPRCPGNLGPPNLRRRMERFLPFSDRRTSKVWNHYTQLSLYRVECNHCKRQLSFHNSTTSMREHLGRKHSIWDGAVPPHNTADDPAPAPLHPHISQSSLHGSNALNAAFPPVLPITVKEEQQEISLPEMAETKPVCAVGGSASTSIALPHQDTDMNCLMYNFPSGEMNSTSGTSGNRSSTKACSNKRAEVLTDLILVMVFRDLQPLSVVEDKGFRLLLSCLEPNYPVPSPSLLGSLLWHRYHILKQFLQQHLQNSLAPHCLTLCVEHWRSIEGCGVGGDGRLYVTVSAHFVDSQWHLARCVLETLPIPGVKENTMSQRGHARFADTLKAVLSDFQLPENFVFCVVHDTPCGTESSRNEKNTAIDSEYQQEFAGPSHPPPSNLPKGWAPLLCAGQALKLCVQEGLCVETVRQTLVDARAIVLHFQHDANAATALSQKAEAVNKESTCLVLNDPGRWTTAIEMCEGLLELKWVISSVLEEQKVASNLADHQWRLIHELVPVLKTVRIAASFLSEDINGPISALMPCLQGVSRLLGQKIAECSCPVVRGVMERIRAGMDKCWSLSDEDALLDSPAVLSSFLDPRFKELRFLSPHARSKLHDKVKELLSAQAYASEERIQSVEMEEPVDEQDEPAVFGLDDPLPMPAIASLDSPESCGSADEGDGFELQPSEPSVAISSPEHANDCALEVDSPYKAISESKIPSSGTRARSPLRGDSQLNSRVRMSPLPQSMYDILLGEDPTERMPEIHQQLENYIAEPLCRRSLSPLHWWRNKEHRFPAVARLARKYLSIPATAVSADQAFAAKESPVTQRRATLGSKHLDHILFLHQNTDYADLLKVGPSRRETDQRNSVSVNQSRDSLYQTLVSYESKVRVPEDS